ncbi:MAG: carbohydrate ABC transporter permease [Proteobacteria bacterium]|nr:carbohydrate ABC transporter permease [Pseudomonadota bacterium]MBI3496605.1 carbohydrate ABC transporter permease [Pseudomonadota bacterium]
MARPLASHGPLQYVLLPTIVLAIVLPFLWILMSSFKYQIDIYQGSWVFAPTLSNYIDVFLSRRSDFLSNVWNSLVVAGASTVSVLTLGALAAYSLHRFVWAKWFSVGLLGWLLVFHMIPVMTLVGPWYLVFRELGLYDTRAALILTHVTINLPMTIWLLLAFFREIPKELEEAAEIDGCRRAQAFRLVALPLVVPGLIAAGVLAFVFSWNEFAIALNLTSRATATVPVGIALFAQQYEVQHSQMAAASIVATIPAILLMFFGQRFVIQGLTLGAVK